MEILRFLISFFAKEYGGGKFAGIYDLFEKNGFDLKKTLENIKAEDIAPIAETFSGAYKKTPTDSVGESFGLSPVKDIADKEVIYALNGYLGEL